MLGILQRKGGVAFFLYKNDEAIQIAHRSAIIVAMAAPITPITMIGGVVPHDQIDKLLQVVFAITEYTYDVIVCYDGKDRYAAHKTENGMECQVFGTTK